MDIALEFIDTFVADYAYAYLFPIGYSNKTNEDNCTRAIEPWVWQPATKLFDLQPSSAAYMSSLARDNPYRQFFTLYFVGW